MSFDPMGRRVYVSGPMTGLPDFNRAEFSRVARGLRAGGALRVFDPSFGADGSKPHEAHMLRDLHELTSNMDGRPYYDAIVQLDGWESSYGARVEAAVARACGIEAVGL